LQGLHRKSNHGYITQFHIHRVKVNAPPLVSGNLHDSKLSDYALLAGSMCWLTSLNAVVETQEPTIASGLNPFMWLSG
jgi:hypothetical protein